MARRLTILAIVALLAAAVYSCGDSGSGSNSPTGPTSPTVTSVTVTGTLSVSGVGQTSQLSAKAHYAKGTTADVTTQATWSSSDATIATVSGGGLVTSAGVGTATIVATYRGVTGSTKMTVTRPPAFTVSGVVTESVPTTSTMLAGVRVDFTNLVNQGRFATTDSSGQYQITDLPAGTYNVRATLAGYVESTKQVTLGGATTLNFALVPTPASIWFTRTGTISGSSALCAGDSHPCQVFAMPPVHNTGAFESTLLWNDTSAYLALQLVNVDTGQVVATSSVPGQTHQYVTLQIQTPGNYQVRVLAMAISGSVPIELHVTACPN